MIAKNNPFNIRYNNLNKWIGLIGETKGFCTFDTLEHGYRAGIVLLCNYVYRKGLKDVSEIIKRFAPDSENDTRSYIRYVVGRLGTDCVVTYDDFSRLCCAMAWFETNSDLSTDMVDDLVIKYNIHFL